LKKIYQNKIIINLSLIKQKKIIPSLNLLTSDNKENSKYINLGKNRTYYENLYKYLLSFVNFKFTPKDNEFHIYLDKL
jgi:hypothetical protein